MLTSRLATGHFRLAWATALLACTAVAEVPAAPKANPSSPAAEARTTRALAEAARSGTAALRGFLYAMPKGADLHMHLTGAIYAESFLRAAGTDGLCVDTATLSLTKPMATTRSIPPQPVCGEGKVRADSLAGKNMTDDAAQHLYDQLIDSFSMRTSVPVSGKSGHDQFFDTFGRFHGLSDSHLGEWLDEVATRAASQNEQYLEIMHTPNFGPAVALAEKVGYHDDFAQYRQLMLDGGLRETVSGIRPEFDQMEARRNQIESCGKAEAKPGCSVEIRYIYQVLRAKSPESVFAQILLGFELASADSRVLAINLVQPEDDYTAMADYRLHMRMIDVLHGLYPKVHITLHAGELALGMVPPEGLKFHIRLAVEQGHAERVGHGVDVMLEDRPYELLKEMAAKRVMVEINLTSNDVILNVKGGDHPLPMYRKFGVSVSLSTDDEGVSRIDLTNEYVRAVATYNLTYPELKQMVRTGIEHTFLPGDSLWVQTATKAAKPGESFERPVSACAGEIGKVEPSRKCAEFLGSSEKAQQQWELERRFRAFEGTF